jgi:hypothetical protein
MIAASHQMYSAQALVDLKEWKNVHGKDSTYTLNRDIVWAKAEYALELALNFKKSNGSRRICYIFVFMIIATMSAKGYGIFLGMVAALISCLLLHY